MAKGRSLADIVGDLEEEAPAPSTTAAPAPRSDPHIVPINIFVTPRDRKRLRQLSLDSGLSMQRLGHEAWNMLLRARGLEPLEPVSANVPSGRLRR